MRGPESQIRRRTCRTRTSDVSVHPTHPDHSVGPVDRCVVPTRVLGPTESRLTHPTVTQDETSTSQRDPTISLTNFSAVGGEVRLSPSLVRGDGPRHREV